MFIICEKYIKYTLLKLTFKWLEHIIYM